ncbi:DUF5683 domain-containing protein [Bacteroidetes bacterium endosymbiont of Geopemphigus sp.]|uniref:DUF5683 domain-containing protein n=1 Tax=Bacteroidetes bacterium endosymbiont of Geopemphigus sp. TaxID=2047937 RepID=UPI000CD118C1|nr:DUF5683 domain-containing protein [Bacteroidetes bacterium endosymbiont of Geopemphigus sp.]
MRNILFYTFFPFLVWSQNTDNQTIQQSSPAHLQKNLESLSWTPVPVQAALYSTALPGLGQAYNKKYWKIPLIWGILGTGTYAIGYYKRNYDGYHSRFITAVNTGTDQKRYIREQLARAQKQASRYYNYAVILMALAYVLNIIDALVDANLYELDHEKEFSLKLTLVPKNNTDPFLGISLNIKF